MFGRKPKAGAPAQEAPVTKNDATAEAKPEKKGFFGLGRAKAKPEAEETEKPGRRERPDAFSFEATRITMLEKNERRAWACAKGLGLTTLALGAAIAIMSPLKQGVPYVFEVDKNTGMTELIRVANPRAIPQSELMDKFWVAQYLRSRENYDYNTIDAEFRRVREMTMADAFTPYMRQFQGENSLDRVLGPAKMIRVELLSVGIEGDGIARVRFIRRQINTANMQPESESYWTATIGYDYIPNYTTDGERLLVNPFGFKVKSYRLDQEFTRAGLHVEPERPVAEKLSPKEQFDLPPEEEEVEPAPAPVAPAPAQSLPPPVTGSQTIPADVQATAPTATTSGQNADGSVAVSTHP